MKQLNINFVKYFFALIFLFSLNSVAQINPLNDKVTNPLSSEGDYSNFYLGISLGYSSPGGDSMDGVENGLEFGFINCGYRINETWGLVLNLNSSGHQLENINDLNVGLAYLSIGAMLSIDLGNDMYLDIKPQIAPSIAAVYTDDSGEVYDTTWRGTGLVVANSLVFGKSKGFSFSLNFDLLNGKWNELESDGYTYDIDPDSDGLSKFTIGGGVRYNF